MIMMSLIISIFIGLAAGFCLHLSLFFAGTLLLSRVQDGRMLCLVAIYTVPLLGQRLHTAPMPHVPFTLGLVTCHPEVVPQWAYVIFPCSLPIAQYLLLT